MSVASMNVKRSVRSFMPPTLWNWLRVLKIRYTILTTTKQYVQHRYGGFPLTVEIGDPIGRGWYDRDWPTVEEADFLREYGLQPGATVFDIGAHQSVLAMVLAKTVEPGQVVSVEGNKYNAEVGQRNAQRNGIGNLRVIHGAGGAKSGTVTFSENWNGEVSDGTPDVGGVAVRCYTIDELSREYGAPQVLYIDVEGYEREVLDGARDTLASHPDCFIEVHVGKIEKYGATAETILSYFPRELYRLFMREDEEGKAFREVHPGETLPNERFFLIAVAKVRAGKAQTN